MTQRETTREPDWPSCATNGCIGLRVEDEEACLAHVASQARKGILAALEPGSDLDLRGTPIDPGLLHQILTAFQSEDEPPTLGNASFDGAQFSGDASFSGVLFNGNVSFAGAQFKGHAWFSGTQYKWGDVSFERAQFRRGAWFGKGQFSSRVTFRGAKFSGLAWFAGAEFSGSVSFDQAQFSDDAMFGGALFLGRASFVQAQLSGPNVSFGRAQFFGRASFDQGRFSGPVAWFGRAQFFSWHASFDQAEFSGEALFDQAKFAEPTASSGLAQLSEGDWIEQEEFSGPAASFSRTQFGGRASFDEAEFSVEASFDQAEFSGEASFDRVKFTGPAASFSEAQFSGSIQLVGAQFRREARFEAAQFKGAGTLGPLLAVSGLILDRATFEQAVVIRAVSRVASFVGTRFTEAATVRLRYAEIALNNTVFSKPSMVVFAEGTFKRPGPDGQEQEVLDESLVVEALGGRSPRPRLASLHGVDVATLTVTELDLASCLFQGAHNLDELRIEGARPFATTPTGWAFGRVGGQGVPAWYWTRRQTLAEEHHWRAARPLPAAPSGRPHPQRVGWDPPSVEAPAWLPGRTGQRVEPLPPARLALLYRALRKAREDRKDEPGAADFYYGEMEMRRLAPQTPWAERVILTLYWLVSGYGLRGLRALGCLLTVFVAATLVLRQWGFQSNHRPWGSAILYTAGALTHLVNPPIGLLNEAGQAVRIIIGLVGPVLLGLALLAVRNRVKR